MATQTLSSDDKGEEEKLEREISELRSEKKTLFEEARPINEKLERIAQRERECVDRLHRLATARHNEERHRQTVQRLVELESELRRVKCENAKLSDTNKKLKQSLDQATRHSKIQKQKIAELDLAMATAQQTGSEIHDDSRPTVVELQKHLSEARELLNNTRVEYSQALNETKQGLNETQKHLCEIQERLTVAEQVTAATQQRAVQESDNSDELLLELTAPDHPAAFTGYVYNLPQA